MFSQKNSYDYLRYFGDNMNVLPFTGEYEPVSTYKSIYIYGITIKDDTIYVDFSNDKIANTVDITESYNINNTELNLKIDVKLKYFRLRITTEDDFSTSHQRMYNVYFYVQQLLTSDTQLTISNYHLEKLDNLSYDDTNRLKTNSKLVGLYNTTQTFLQCNASGGLIVETQKDFVGNDYGNVCDNITINSNSESSVFTWARGAYKNNSILCYQDSSYTNNDGISIFTRANNNSKLYLGSSYPNIIGNYRYYSFNLNLLPFNSLIVVNNSTSAINNVYATLSSA